MSTAGSTHGFESSLNSLREVFVSLKERSVSMGADKGVFVRNDLMKIAETKVANMFKEFEGQDPPEDAQVLATQIADLKQAHNKALESLKNAESKVAEHKATLDTAQNDIRKHESGTGGTKADLLGEQKRMGVVIEDLNKELGQVKIQLAAAQRGGNADEVESVIGLQHQLKETLRVAHDERKSFTKKLADVSNKIEELILQRDTAAKALKASQIEVSSLKTKRTLANKRVPVEPVDIQVNIPLVRMLLGDKGMAKLKALDLQRREAIQNYAYGLLDVANSSSSTRQIGDLLKIALTWVKTKSFAAREVLRGWLDSIYKDMCTGCVKALKFYRVALQDVIGEFKKAQQKAKQEKPDWKGSSHWWYATILYFQQQRKRLRLVSRVLNMSKSVYQGTVKFVSGVYVGFTRLFWADVPVSSAESTSVPETAETGSSAHVIRMKSNE